MAFVLTLLYVALSLLSPSVLPEAIWSLHVNIILGIAVILTLIPQLGRLRALPDWYLVLGLVFAAAISMVPVGLSTIYPTLMGYIPILIVFYFVMVACTSLSRIRTLVWVLLGVALFIFVQGWLAERAHDLLSPYMITEGGQSAPIYRHQGLGVLGDPNDTAQFFVTLIPLMFLRWKKGSPLPNLLFTILPVSVLVLGIYYTHSRGGALALIAVCLFGFKDKLGLVFSSVLAVGLFAGMMAVNISGGRGMNEDDGSRVAFWSAGLSIFKSHPLIGIGIGRFAEYNGGLTAHNSYVVCLAEVGLVGYICWMGTIVLNLTGLSRMASSDKDQKKKLGSGAAMPPPHLRWRPAIDNAPALSSGMPMAATAIGSPGFASLAYAQPVPLEMAPASVRFAEQRLKLAPDGEDAELVRAAKVLRIAFVGLLASGYFISRAFSMMFYVLIGISAALRLLYLQRHPDARIEMKSMLKRVLAVVVGSVTFIYLFVRVRGIH